VKNHPRLAARRADHRDPLTYPVFANDGRSLTRAVGASLANKITELEKRIFPPDTESASYQMPDWIDAGQECIDEDRPNNLSFSPYVYVKVVGGLIAEYELFQVRSGACGPHLRGHGDAEGRSHASYQQPARQCS
jgi:hypothetical protein